jgi:hypothetical protein
MAFIVKLYSLADESALPEYVSPLTATVNDTLASFRLFLEGEGLINYPFYLWVLEDKKCMIQRFERWNRVTPEMFVIPREESASGRNKCQRIDEDSAIVFDSCNGFPEPTEFPSCDQEEGEPTMAMVSTGVTADELPLEEVCLKRLLLKEELWKKYENHEKKLRKGLIRLTLDDQVWFLKSWDSARVAVVKIHCEECDKDFGGNGGDHSSHTMRNLFANFRKHHLHTQAHLRSFYRQHNLEYSDHLQSGAPKGQALVITKAEHEKLVEEGIEIVEEVNSTLPKVDEKIVFYVMGDTKAEGLKFRSYWFKVRCRVCGFMCQLCPPKKTLHMNLMNHVEGFKHTKMLAKLLSS